jgi:Contractile injection system tube protein/LysM domain
MTLVKAHIENRSNPDAPHVPVLFNPTEYGIDRGVVFADLPVPGLAMPLLQFVRGETETLTLELFLDKTLDRHSVDDDLETLRGFLRIDHSLHAPPVCAFVWGQVDFEGVVSAMREKYTLFSDDGHVMRARVNLTLKSYKAAEVQQRAINPASPDRSRFHVVRDGDRLSAIAAQAYGDPRQWRLIADANDLDRPRFLTPGQTLRIPAIRLATRTGS